MNSRGKYIVFNGIEGSGKDTQISMLTQRLRAKGVAVHVTREPGGSDLTARAIRHITQNPQYDINTKTEVLLYNASRAQSLEQVNKLLERGVWVISNYNFLCNLAIQYYARNDGIAYDDITAIIDFAVGGMQGDLSIILDIPAEVSVERKAAYRGGERFDNLRLDFLQRMRDGYLKEAEKRHLVVIDAVKEPDKVAEKIWQSVAPLLKKRDTKSTVATQPQRIGEILQEKLETSYVKSNEQGILTMTDEGKNYLKDAITNVEDNVYVFTDKLSPTTVAAAMARLSRRGDDMRITILDEFSNTAGKDEKLLQRVITAYGDDSVQQLVGLHLVVEGASNLLTKKLEWGRLAAYLEQSTRYIYFDQKDARGNYKYYTPTTLDAKSAQSYESTMNTIFDLYSNMVRACTEYIQKHSEVPEAERDAAWKSATRAQACDAIRPVLPVATKSTVGIFASGQALESLIMHLQSDELAEARDTGDKMLFEARKVMPAFLERADKPDRGGATIAYRIDTRKAIQDLVSSKLSSTHSISNPAAVTLSQVFPHNELDLLPHMLYEQSHLSLQELEDEIASWSYKDKVKAFQTYIGERLNRRHKPGRAIEFAHYTFDLVCDYGIFRDLQRHRMVDELEWQSLTPRYGYEVPKLVDDSGLTEKFEQCFDLSLKLYSSLQAAGYEMEAQYATLLGHKMRWKLTYNAREAFHLHELRTSPQGHPGYRKLVQEMHEKVAEAHPMLAEGMRFVNQGEDPELSRLAAERYTQMKLKQLNK